MHLAVLIFHICAGLVGLLSGVAAMSFPKGSRGHRAAGNVFFVAMLCLGTSAVYLAFLKHQTSNVFGGILTCYLIATGWLTGRRKDSRSGVFDFAALLVALAVGACEATYGLAAAHSPTGLKDGYSAGVYFFSGFVALLAAAGDVRMLVKGGIFGVQRIARHLWRMCFGLFIATGSFFLGQQQVFPASVRGTPILVVLSVLPLAAMIYWLLRIHFAKAYKETTAAFNHPAEVQSAQVS